MTEIALRTYVEQLDNLIERKQIDEVLAHCRHILSLYPKHLDSYRVLGKALLEKGRHTDAADIFQRVLSVAPDDFIAHVGMSIVREDEASLDAAIWHMERAFEAAPSNGAIQQELCRLYGRRDGVTPPKARLTRGALARMYYQGGLFLQAETELKTALHDDPERIDLLSLLARVYWQSDQPTEAAQACATVLAKLPYSYDANRILASIFHEQGRGEEAAGYRQRLEALDPYEAFAPPAQDGAAARRVEASRVNLERLDYIPGADDGGSPDWLASIGARFDSEPEAAPAQPDWLAEDEQAGPPVSPLDVPASADVPDWLRDLQPQASAPPGPAAEPASSAPDWLRDLGVDADAVPAAQVGGESLPDWLQAATGALPGESIPDWMLPAFREPEQPAAASAPAEAAADVPDWLRTLTAQPGGETIQAAPPAADPEATLVARPTQPPPAPPDAVEPLPTVAEADLPDWLRAMTPAAGPTAEADADVPDWMQTLTPATAEAALPPADQPSLEPPAALETFTHTPDEAEAETISPAAGVPDWLKDIAPAATDETVLPEAATEHSLPADLAVTRALPGEALAETSAGIPDWLKAMAPTEADSAAPQSASAEADAEVADWLQTASAQPSDLSPVAPAADISAEPAAEIPDWLKAMAPTDEAPSAQAEPVAPWLAGQVLEDEIASAPAASTEDASVPGWLQAPDLAAAPPEPPAVPDWLQAVASTAPPPDTGPLAAREPEPGAPETPAAIELPDFLQPASPEAIARAERPFMFDDAEGDDDFSSEPDEPDLVLPADIPEWLQALAPLTPDPVDALASAPPSAQLAMDAEPAEAVDLGHNAALSEASAEGAAPWLSGLEAGSPPDSLVIPASEADLEQAAALDIPAWAQPQVPDPTDTIASWLKAKDVPEWLRPDAPGLEQVSAASLPEGAAAILEPEAAAPEPALPAGAPPIETIDEDEALRWLESLAAKQGAQPEELITAPEDRPAETPAWIAAQQGEVAALDSLDASETLPPSVVAAEPTPSEPAVPEWLRASDAEPPVEAPVPVDLSLPEPAPPATAEAEAPSLEAYLGQVEAALPVEDLADTAPVHAQAAPAAEAPKPAEIDEAQPLLPASLAELAAAVPAEPEAAQPPAVTVEPAAVEAVAALEADDEALRWLESLAAQHGAQPDELLTAPEERLAEPPAWVAAEAGAALLTPEPTAAELQPQSQPEPDIAAAADLEPEPLPEPEPAAVISPPEWLPASLVAEDEAAPAEEPRPSTGDLRLSRLADRLAETRRAREAEIEARFAEQRAEQEAARRLVQERLSRRAPPEPAPEPAHAPIPQPAVAGAAPAPDWSAAADRYAAWVQTGEHLDQAIRELEDLAHQHTPPAPVLRVLGDAYTRRGQLADALDAYRLALERL